MNAMGWDGSFVGWSMFQPAMILIVLKPDNKKKIKIKIYPSSDLSNYSLLKNPMPLAFMSSHTISDFSPS